jgi:glucose-6-phosphate 1-dehydrogenase
LRAAWSIFTPLLNAIDEGKVPIHEYEFGSRGPAEADVLLNSTGYKRPVDYVWSLNHLSLKKTDK